MIYSPAGQPRSGDCVSGIILWCNSEPKPNHPSLKPAPVGGSSTHRSSAVRPRLYAFFFLSPPDIDLRTSSMTEYTSTKPMAMAAPIFCSSVSTLPVTAAM